VRDPPGRIRLDVAVTDAAGAPVAGLGEQDFQLLDEGRPQKLVSFAASDSGVDAAGFRTSILLVIDAVNSGAEVALLREDAEQFLRQNGGHLAYPVTVLVLTDTAYHVLGRSSLDGNALAQAVHDFKPDVPVAHSAAENVVHRYQVSLRAISIIADREVDVPGRKMMIWMGPGWPILPESQSQYDTRVHALNFDALAMLTNHLREGRVAVCSAGGGGELVVRDFLRPVKAEWDVSPGNLALQVIALHSGGGALGLAKHGRWVELVNGCMKQVGAFYSLSFDRPASAKVFAYHALKVTVDKPGLTVRTNAGYYSEP
jgi:VWFA-related protein